MKNCNKIKHTCGSTSNATCIHYESNVNVDSEFTNADCLTIEETTQDIYNQLENLDLSALGELCLSYVQENNKNIVKNVLLKFEEEICNLKEEVETVKNRQLCDMLIGDCVDVKCLTDICDNSITTFGELLQSLIDKSCE